MRLAFACDHAGYELKAYLMDRVREEFSKIELVDLGAENSSDSVDYPVFGFKIGRYIAANKADFGVAICGSGIGISMAANRIKGARAALCHDVTTGSLSRKHNDANILALGERLIGKTTAWDCLEAFLTTKFEGGRHSRRVEMLCKGI